MPTQLLLAHPDFQTFRRPCVVMPECEKKIQGPVVIGYYSRAGYDGVRTVDRCSLTSEMNRYLA